MDRSTEKLQLGRYGLILYITPAIYKKTDDGEYDPTPVFSQKAKILEVKGISQQDCIEKLNRIVELIKHYE